MSQRTTEAYESVFNYIHEHLIYLTGDAIIIDFEKAMRKALLRILKKYNSDMLILSCWFHFCQALRRKLAQMPALFEKVKADETYRTIFRRFQCLPLLPLHHIEESFRSLSKTALRLNKDLFAPFVNYFNKEWMKTVTPSHFCLYMRGKRTTAQAESFNGKVNKTFRTHGSFFQFCEISQTIEVATTNELANYINGIQQKDTRHLSDVKRSELIRKLSIEYENNPQLLLNALANPKNATLYAENEISTGKEEIENTADVELYGNEDGTIYPVAGNESESEIRSQTIVTSENSTNESNEAVMNDNAGIQTRSRAVSTTESHTISGKVHRAIHNVLISNSNVLFIFSYRFGDD